MTKVGFLGTGLMGQPMIKRLLTSNISVIAYNRTVSKLEGLKESGVIIAQSPTEVVQNSDCIILMLTNATAIKDLLLTEITSKYLIDRTIIQMGTIAPQESIILQQEITAKGGEYLEAPVLGSIPEAQNGNLLVMVGSTETQFKKWSYLLQNFGSEPILIGEVGTAAALKLALNQLIASLTSSFALSLGFLSRQGVDIDQFMNILRQSALYAPTFDKKLARMCDGNYDNPNFPTKHLLKDVNLFLQESESLNLMSDSLNGVQKILEKAIELGLSDADYSALYSAIVPKS
ncbi:hydroxyacid dehydrogenase [Aphanothece hegewaldii CCALA 016]|uniref:Hydroxyacid dehydrogenase n=1 Tax=Aphanothece hegewaldii CCALA 016 TaxID=2107694 RepID=A0A2T1LXC8_9CHRO|nr:NAD(P)-dependent oxidoreductase [Aphanothece hegewaldii]PSF36851.1 hydroxyacid dehydrogenase [Aphanothece hegewaldii CCALA 016]